MPVSAETLRLLMEAGLEGNELLRIVASIDADIPTKSRSANAERQARFRARRKADSVTSNVTNNVTESVTPRARVEDNLQTNNLSGQRETKKAASLSDVAAFRADLEQDCSPDQVEAFIKHRKAKNGQNSAYAAKLFRRDAASCGLSVSEAVDMAISRGWLTVKPEYLAGRRQTATSPPPKKTVGQQARDELRRMGMMDAPDEQTRHFGQGDRGSDFAGTGFARRIASTAGG